MAFPRKQRLRLKNSFEKLEHALTLLKTDDFESWLVLLAPYLGDPGDPALVAEWREKFRRWEKEHKRLLKDDPDLARGWKKKRPHLAERHDRAIDKLVDYLGSSYLYVVFPSRMTTREETQVERRNDELFALYERLRGEGMKKRLALQDAAQMCGYSEARAYEIVRLREGGEKRPRAG